MGSDRAEPQLAQPLIALDRSDGVLAIVSEGPSAARWRHEVLCDQVEGLPFGDASRGSQLADVRDSPLSTLQMSTRTADCNLIDEDSVKTSWGAPMPLPYPSARSARRPGAVLPKVFPAYPASRPEKRR